jgi:hypothetical protein
MLRAIDPISPDKAFELPRYIATLTLVRLATTSGVRSGCVAG